MSLNVHKTRQQTTDLSCRHFYVSIFHTISMPDTFRWMLHYQITLRRNGQLNRQDDHILCTKEKSPQENKSLRAL
jgi:hypothetical protein